MTIIEIVVRCEQCYNVNFSGNNGKNVTCDIAKRIIPNINYVPGWCPLKKSFRKIYEQK